MITTTSNKTVHTEVKTPLGLPDFIYVEQNLLHYYIPVFQEESELFQHSKISNITQQGAEYLYGVIFCNYKSYKHCINITMRGSLLRNRLSVFPS